MVPTIKGKNSVCHICQKPRVWMMSYNWHMKHAEYWTFWSKINIRYTDIERAAQNSRSGRREDRESYLYDLKERLDVDPDAKSWKGSRTRFCQMWVPGVNSLRD